MVRALQYADINPIQHKSHFLHVPVDPLAGFQLQRAKFTVASSAWLLRTVFPGNDFKQVPDSSVPELWILLRLLLYAKT